MANGFSVSALVGRKEIMKLGGLDHDKERVFVMSYTYGAEHHGLSAALETMKIYEKEPVVETLWRQGERLANGIRKSINENKLTDFQGGYEESIVSDC
jgi:glutamate-1-semialdehyde 2,1-aminomutase